MNIQRTPDQLSGTICTAGNARRRTTPSRLAPFCSRFVAVSAIAILASVGCAEHSEALSESREDPVPRLPRLTVQYVGSNDTLPVIVDDRLGRSVRFANHPLRIVSLSPSTTELLYAIGAGAQLVAATRHCNYPAAARELPRVGGGTLESISREKLFDFAPDLVLCKWDNHEPLITMLDRFGIPALALGPETLDDLYQEAVVLGQVTGREANAGRLVSQMKARVAALSAVVGTIPLENRRSVFYEVWDEPLMTAGPTSFIGELLELAETDNIFADTTTRYPRVSAEAVVGRNPDVILAPSTHATEVTREEILNRQGWDQINALRNEQIFLIDGDRVSRCGPRLIDALEEVIRVVYPEQYASRPMLTTEGGIH